MALAKTKYYNLRQLGAIGIAAVCLFSELASTGSASEAPKNSAKFLFIVDTSSTMNRYDHAGRQTLFDFIFTGISKQMQSGDTFGVWTFNEQVSAGSFPMQVWDADQNLELATRAGVFLKGQHYQGKPHAEKAMQAALGLLKSVKDVNVFLITSGDSSLGLTDLEKRLKDLYQQKAAAARKKNLPVVLSFSTWNGEIVKADVTISGEPARLPAELLAKAREKTKAPAPDQVARAAEPSMPRVRPKPIIMIGEKPAPKIPSETAAAAPASTNQSQTPTPASPQSAAAPQALASAKTVPPPASTEPQQPSAKAPAPASELLPKPITVSAREPVVKSAEAGPQTVPSLAVGVPPKTGLDARWIMFAGCVFFAAALVLGGWVLYRIRSSRETSIISRSMAQR